MLSIISSASTLQTMAKIKEPVDISHKIAGITCVFGLMHHAVSTLSPHEDRPGVLSRIRYKPAGIKRTCSSWTCMLITAFVMIRNQSDARATGALEFPRSSSEDRHVH